MSDIHYLLSETFAYEKTIHADAGPGYARRQRWTTDRFFKLRELAPHSPTLIDNRIEEPEMMEFIRIAATLERHPIYVKVVDPYWECIRQPYYQWLLKLTRLANVYFIGPYQTTGITKVLRDLTHADAYVHVPYAYESEREQPLDTASRKKLLVVSGAAHVDFYPERAAMLRAIRRHWWSARKVTVLPHPGYPDLGHVARHNITGDDYLKFLATHRFMYLEPSREGLEFLKYSECAYAGCVPAGRMPPTLPVDSRQVVVPIESEEFVRDLGHLASIKPEECEHLAQRYRASLKGGRDPAALNADLIGHWKRQRERLTAGVS